MNFGEMTGERHYLHLEPKVVVEPWLRLNGDFCHDYKVHLYKGQPTSLQIALRHGVDNKMQRLQLTPDWKVLPGESFFQGQLETPPDIDPETLKPECLPRMLEISRQVGRHVDFVRVDFFTDGKDRLYVGEISHIIAGTRVVFRPVEQERVFTTPPQAKEGMAG